MPCVNDPGSNRQVQKELAIEQAQLEHEQIRKTAAQGCEAQSVVIATVLYKVEITTLYKARL